MRQLTHLSIENLNGEPMVRDRAEEKDSRKQYGLVTPALFDNMRHKTLQYVNFCNK